MTTSTGIRRCWLLTVVLLACAALGCGGGLQLRQVLTKTDLPARVTVLYTVEAESGPVAGMNRANFSVLEDGRPAGAEEWKFANPDLSSRQHTLLLLDYSGEMPAPDRAAMAAAAQIFVDVLKGTGKVAIYVFDGEANAHEIVPFSTEITEEQLKKLETFEVKDQSTNLNGAYRTSFDKLDDALRAEALGIGSMVVVSRGPDRANRVSRADVVGHVEDKLNVSRYAVGVGPQAKEALLEELASVAPDYVGKLLDLGKALFAIGEKVKEQGKSYYVVSYCSPSRAQVHIVDVEATRSVKNAEGEAVEERGSLSHEFSADGFGGGCDPTIPDDWSAAMSSDDDEEKDGEDKGKPDGDAAPGEGKQGADPANPPAPGAPAPSPAAPSPAPSPAPPPGG